MIYLQNTQDVQLVYIPVSRALSEDGDFRFRLFNTVNLTENFEELLSRGDYNEDFNEDFAIDVTPIMTPGGLYYTFTVAFYDSLPEGSYEYVLTKGNKVVSLGNAEIGDYTPDSLENDNLLLSQEHHTDYDSEENKQTIEYEQY